MVRYRFMSLMMEGSKLFVIFLLSTDAENFKRDDKRGERHAYLVRNSAKRLSSAILDGRYMCELLNADKFQNSSNFLHSGLTIFDDIIQLNDRESFALAGYAGVNKPQWNTQKRANGGQGPSEIFPQIAPSMESSKLLVTFLLSLPLSTNALFGAKHFNRDDKRGERHAYFVRDPAKRLNSSILDSFMVSEPMGCVFRCIGHQECYSVNFAAVSHYGRHTCELLNADKFQNSSNFLHSVNFDHYNIKSPCMSNPCLDGALFCRPIYQQDDYQCVCKPGFTGHYCETDINECSSNPCLNGGVCNDQVNGYVCACLAGYTGLQCGTNINECSSNPCLNGGTCTDQVNGYICSCIAMYTGPRCGTVRVLDIYIRSEGCDDPGKAPICGKAYIKVDGTDYSLQERGFNVVVVNGETGVFLEARSFDTYEYSSSGYHLRDYLNSLSGNKIVLVATQDSASEHMSPAIDALKRLGATDPLQGNHRDSFAFAGYAGVNKPQWITQKRAARYLGPSEIFPQISLSINQ
ncbi:unnamed protein product [Pocillopora meandrina]|uniref:EGF-like domain-containing protein n=1 Tax=Pocillopora meandrina TaxID=46732 RepID=A0AAU9WDJ3_9CNID|nr:unnamed protein product [Pocillopora meandrina]